MKATAHYRRTAIGVMKSLADKRKEEMDCQNEKKEKELIDKVKNSSPVSTKYKKYLSLENDIDDLKSKRFKILEELEDLGMTIDYKDNLSMSTYRIKESILPQIVSHDYTEIVGRLELQISKADTTEEIDDLLNGAFGEGFTDNPVSIDPPKLKMLSNK